MEEGKKESSPNSVSHTLKVDVVSAPFFRAVHADASWARISPAGYIHLSFYNECPPMPRQIAQDINSDGTWAPGPRLAFATEANVIRQVEVDVIMSVESAKHVRDNLQTFIQLAEDARLKDAQPKEERK